MQVGRSIKVENDGTVFGITDGDVSENFGKETFSEKVAKIWASNRWMTRKDAENNFFYLA